MIKGIAIAIPKASSVKIWITIKTISIVGVEAVKERSIKAPCKTIPSIGVVKVVIPVRNKRIIKTTKSPVSAKSKVKGSGLNNDLGRFIAATPVRVGLIVIGKTLI